MSTLKRLSLAGGTLLVILVVQQGFNLYLFFTKHMDLDSFSWGFVLHLSTGISSFLYIKNDLYATRKISLSPLRNLRMITFLCSQVSLFFISNYEFFLRTRTRISLSPLACGFVIGNLCQVCVILNEAIFIHDALHLKANLESFAMSLIVTAEGNHQFHQGTLQQFEVKRRLKILERERTIFQSKFSKSVFLFCGSRLLQVVVLTVTFLSAEQDLDFRYIVITFLRLIGLAVMSDVSQALGDAQNHILTALRRIIFELSGTADLSILMECRRALEKEDFSMCAAGLMLLNRKTLISQLGLLVTYCVLVYQLKA